MWKTSSNLMSVDNGWIVDFVFQYVPMETDPPIMEEVARKQAKVMHMIFSSRAAAVQWLVDAIDLYQPGGVEKDVDQVGNV